jgi:hypothetical protein
LSVFRWPILIVFVVAFDGGEWIVPLGLLGGLEIVSGAQTNRARRDSAQNGFENHRLHAFATSAAEHKAHFSLSFKMLATIRMAQIQLRFCAGGGAPSLWLFTSAFRSSLYSQPVTTLDGCTSETPKIARKNQKRLAKARRCPVAFGTLRNAVELPGRKNRKRYCFCPRSLLTMVPDVARTLSLAHFRASLSANVWRLQSVRFS